MQDSPLVLEMQRNRKLPTRSEGLFSKGNLDLRTGLKSKAWSAMQSLYRNSTAKQIQGLFCRAKPCVTRQN